MRVSSSLALLLVLGCGGSPPPSPSSPGAASPAPVEGGAASPAAQGPPVAVLREVVHTYHGTAVSDPYEWLEGRNDAVRAWSRGQNEYARQVLDAVPGRAAITARVRELITASPDWWAPQYQAGKLLMMEARPPKQQPYLVEMAKPDPSGARVVVDPNVIDATGGTSIDWFVPSDDARLVAVSMSQGGSESGTVHVYEVASGRELDGDVVPFAHGGTAGGDLAWAKDGSGFWYTRYPHPGERPPEELAFHQQVYFHRLGTSAGADAPSLTEGLPRLAEISFERSLGGRWLLARIACGDGGEFMWFVLDTAARTPAWRLLADRADKVIVGGFAVDESLWLMSRREASKGELLRLDLAQAGGERPLSRARRVVRAGEDTLAGLMPAATRVYAGVSLGGPAALRIFDAAVPPAGAAREHGSIPLLPISALTGWERLEGDDLLYRNQSFVHAPAWYRWDSRAGRAEPTPLAQTAAASFDDAEVVREVCTSKDGTQVPLSVVRRKGTPLDGSSPTLLTGYGGYDIIMQPYFDVLVRLFLDHGGVYAVANLRGGGEHGEAWHLAGNLTHKQNVFDDFLACAHHLVDVRYTTPERLAIQGGSNGGLLVGAALTQEPELFRAVVAEVGIFDMLRVELSFNGQFNVPEFGTVTDPEQFRALYAYSPYHHVRDGQRYPATLFMTGDNDPRVEPFQSRKMVARMQAAAPEVSVLLRTSGNTGHSMGTPLDAEIEQAADVWGFLFWQLGIDVTGGGGAGAGQ